MRAPDRKRFASVIRTCLVGSLGSLGSLGCDGAGEPAPEAVAAERTVEIEVLGMHCQACVDAITTGLMKREGVKSVAVDLEGELATVVVAGGGPSDEVIREAIDKMGFEAKVRAPAPPES